VRHLDQRVADLRAVRRGARASRGRRGDVRRLVEPVEPLQPGAHPGGGCFGLAGRGLGLRRREPGHAVAARRGDAARASRRRDPVGST
jgi:hypothetical protein